ncbi:MAG: hypothetical protein ABIE42_09145 [Candidatus Eisenbacteria bacterium]
MSAATVIEILKLGMWVWEQLVEGQKPGDINLAGHLERTRLVRKAARERALRRVQGRPALQAVKRPEASS